MAATHDNNDDDDKKYTIRFVFGFDNNRGVFLQPSKFIEVSESMTFNDVFEYARENYPPSDTVESNLLNIVFENKLQEIAVTTHYFHQFYLGEKYFDMTLADFEQEQLEKLERHGRRPLYRAPLENEFRPAYLLFVMSSEKREQTPIKSARKTAAALLKRFDGDIESAAQMMAGQNLRSDDADS